LTLYKLFDTIKAHQRKKATRKKI